MASQISHIVYAKQYLLNNSHLNFNEEEFICGCVFPDIRRISDEIRKIKTHFVFDANCDFDNLESFEAGWKFHIYCDKRREEVLESLKFYQIKNTHLCEDASNKLVEDIILYRQLNENEWSDICKYLRKKAREGYFSESVKEEILHWYTSIANYVQISPTREPMLKLLLNFNTSEEKSLEIIQGVDLLLKDGAVIELLKEMKLGF